MDHGSKQPVLEPAWISADFNRPEPAVIANGVVFALSTGENPQQTTGPRIVYSNQKLLTDAERSANTSHAILYALDAKTGTTLYQSGGAMTSWVHFSGLGLANGRLTPWITIPGFIASASGGNRAGRAWKLFPILKTWRATRT